jgi:hypothetical protein
VSDTVVHPWAVMVLMHTCCISIWNHRVLWWILTHSKYTAITCSTMMRAGWFVLLTGSAISGLASESPSFITSSGIHVWLLRLPCKIINVLVEQMTYPFRRHSSRIGGHTKIVVPQKHCNKKAMSVSSKFMKTKWDSALEWH